MIRRYLGLDARGVGRYSSETLGLADDYQDADDAAVLAFADAQRLAHESVRAADKGAISGPLTVATAVEDYLKFLRAERRSAGDAEIRVRTHILPALGKLRIDALTTDMLAHWRDELAATPARVRTRAGATQRHKASPQTEDARRARRATVNRTVTVLKAALNRAFEHGRVADDTAWRRLKPYRGVAAARPGWLTIEQAQRLISAADAPSGFRALVHGALLTGCRYGELCELRAGDYARGRVAVRRSKSGKARDVRLTEEGAEFFRQMCGERASDEHIFRRADGKPWGKSHQAWFMAQACRTAKVPAISFHQLRHTWASLALMNGVPMLVVAGNLGHSDTRMVEKHYGHLAEDYVDEVFRKGAPRYGAVEPSNVAPLRGTA